MAILLKMAWNSVFAYGKRSLITIFLTVCTTGLMVFSSAFMSGSHDAMIRNGVEIYPGYIQITHRDFDTMPGLESLLFDVEEIQTILAGTEGVAAFGARFESFVLYSHEKKAVAGLFTGVEPEVEPRLSRLRQSLIQGEFLAPGDMGKIYMGEELAKRLDLAIGDSLAFIGTGADYSFAADNLILKGTFKTGLFSFDASGAFVTKEYMDTVMATENIASHVIVLPEELNRSAVLAERINRRLGPDSSARDWRMRLSGLVQAMKLDSIFGYITLGIIFLVIFFVIMIYTYLAVYARVREVGILRAIGTTPAQIRLSFLFESCILTSVSVVAGGVLGGAAAYYFQLNPIDYSGFEEQFKQYGIAVSSMPAVFSPSLVFRDMGIMFLLSVASTLYPIFKITRYHPVEAIHHV